MLSGDEFFDDDVTSGIFEDTIFDTFEDEADHGEYDHIFVDDDPDIYAGEYSEM